MSFKESLFIIKRKLFKKNNIVFMIVLTILLVIIFSSLTVLDFILKYKNDMETKNNEAKTIIVYEKPTEENIKKLKEIENVKFVGSKRFLRGTVGEVKELNKTFSNAFVFFEPLIDGVELKIISGKEEINNGEAICPLKFYPYDLDDKNTIINKEIINGKDLIGKTITSATTKDFMLNPDEKYYKKFTVVGVYDQKYNMASLDRCYITKDDFLEIASPYESGSKATYEDGRIEYDYDEYQDTFILVDKYKNVPLVEEELKKMNYTYDIYFAFDKGELMLFTYGPIFVVLIVVLIAINIMYNFISKKIKERIKNYALLKAVGYDDKTISNNEILENVICFLASYIVSLVIFIIGFFLVKKYFMSEYILEGIMMNFPIVLLIVSFIFLLGLLIFINRKIINKKLNLDISKLIRNEV